MAIFDVSIEIDLFPAVLVSATAYDG